jgi:hypothetical protein
MLTVRFQVSSGWPGWPIMRIGQVDNLDVQSKQLRPKVEQYVRSRADWVGDLEGADGYNGNFFGGLDTTPLKK